MRQWQLDFPWLKQQISIEHFLEHRGLSRGLRRRGHRLVGPCPIHGGDNPSAFVVDCRRDLWHCFTRCQAGGDLVELLRCVDGISYRQVALSLFDLVHRDPHSVSGPTTQRPPTLFRPFPRRLALDSSHPFLQKKGILPETAARFEVGAFYGKGMLEECIAVRLRDPSGSPIGYAGRRLRKENLGKWVFPPALPKSRILYQYHKITAQKQRPIILVEDPWSVLRLQQLHLPAVALFGVNLSRHQEHLLSSFKPILIMFDGDAAGRHAQHRICSFTEAHPIWLDNGLDPDDLTDKQLQQLVSPYLSL